MASAGAGAVTETITDADAVTITDAVTVTEAGALAFSFLVEAPASSALLSVQETVLKDNTEGVEGETSVSIPSTDIYRVSSRKSYIYYQLIHHLGLVLCFVALLLQTILFVTFL
jgi:hypothetical protein